MALVIVWELADGSLSFTAPGGGLPVLPGETEAAYLDRVASATQEAVPLLAGATRRPNIDPATLPASRRWRNAWRRSGGTIGVHANEARKLKRAEMVAEREVRLEKVRKKLRDAEEDNAAPATIAALRQKSQDLRALDEATLTTRLSSVAVADLADWEPAEFAQT